MFQIFFSNADAWIFYQQVDRCSLLSSWFDGNENDYLSLWSKFDGVANKVVHYLTESQRISY